MRKSNKEIKKLDIRKYALFLINKRSYFSFELSRKLIDKGYDLKEINKLIDSFNDSLLINDEEKFKYTIENLQKIKKYGKERIKYELIKKGASNNIVKEKIKEYYIDEIEKEIMNELIERKKQELINEDIYKIKEKTYTYLKRRGF